MRQYYALVKFKTGEKSYHVFSNEQERDDFVNSGCEFYSIEAIVGENKRKIIGDSMLRNMRSRKSHEELEKMYDIRFH